MTTTAINFRVDSDVKRRLEDITEQLGLNPSRILRDALLDKLVELEETALLMERIKTKNKKRSIEDVWKELEN